MAAITVRMDDDLHEKLGMYRAFTGCTANHLICLLIREFFASRGDAEITHGMTDRAARMYGPALDELSSR